MAQNTSHAVMAQRSEPTDSLDDFPTPPWATRALVEHVIADHDNASLSVMEPACGRGYMSQALAEYFGAVTSSDVHDYGFAETRDFLGSAHATTSVDWIITNPPFRLAEGFIGRALPIARVGVAMLVRTVFLESVGRYERLFSASPPTVVAQFSERVPMVKGRVDRKASTATGYAWLVWQHEQSDAARLAWIPPCRKRLERDGDYLDSFLRPDSNEQSEPHDLFAHV